MFQSTTQIRVRYAETDQMGVVYYGNYAQYFEVGRAESIRGLGYSYKDMEEEGIIMPVVEMQIRYIRPAKYDDLLTVKTIVKELPLHHKITFFQEVYNENQELLTKGEVSLFFLDAKTRSKSTLPPKLHSLLEGSFIE